MGESERFIESVTVRDGRTVGVVVRKSDGTTATMVVNRYSAFSPKGIEAKGAPAAMGKFKPDPTNPVNNERALTRRQLRAARDDELRKKLVIAEKSIKEKDAEIAAGFDAIFSYVPELRDENGDELTLAGKIRILCAEIARLRADQADWRKGVEFIAACAGDAHPRDLCAVRIGEMVLAIRAELEKLKGGA